MLERILSVLLTLSALAVAGTLVAREVSDRRGPAGPTREPDLHLQPEWEELLRSGRVIGPPDAPGQIIVFVDVEGSVEIRVGGGSAGEVEGRSFS